MDDKLEPVSSRVPTDVEVNLEQGAEDLDPDDEEEGEDEEDQEDEDEDGGDGR